MDTNLKSTQTNPSVERILRLGDVKYLTGISRSQIYKLVGENQFPAPIKLTSNGRCSGWIHSEIQAFIANRISASREGGRA